MQMNALPHSVTNVFGVDMGARRRSCQTGALSGVRLMLRFIPLSWGKGSDLICDMDASGLCVTAARTPV